MLQGEATHLRTLAEQKLGFMGGGGQYTAMDWKGSRVEPGRVGGGMTNMIK